MTAGALIGTPGALLRRGRRAVVIAAIAAGSLGLAPGGAAYRAHGGPDTLPALILIDAMAIAGGSLRLLKPRR